MQILYNRRWFPLLLLIITTLIAAGICEYLYSGWQTALVDGFISAACFTATVWCGVFPTRRYPTHVAAVVYSIFIGVVAGFLSWSLSSSILQWWFEDNYIYLDRYDASSFSRMLLHVIGSCWVISFGAMRKRNEDLEQKMTHIADAATLHKEAELFKLRQQLQPHFLYNSLNSINALIMVSPDDAQDMVGKLSDFLRASVKRDAQKEIAVYEELNYIETYLAIESVRFGDRLKVIYNKEYDEQATIPPFLLQPVLENAIKFGLYGNTGEVVIKITISQVPGMLIIQVENPFNEQTRPSSGTGFGLDGINRRLYLLYGRTDLLETDKDHETFITRLKIPQQHA